MGFPRQEYWSGLPFPSPGDLPNSGIESMSPVLQADSLSLGHREALNVIRLAKKFLWLVTTLFSYFHLKPNKFFGQLYILKDWLSSLCSIIYLCSLFILYTVVFISYPLSLSYPSPLASRLTTSLFPISVIQFVLLYACFILSILHISDKIWYSSFSV